MLSVTLRVKTKTGEGDYLITPRVQVDFEREFKVGLSKALVHDQKMEHIYWLGWRSQKEAGEVVKPFNDWLSALVSVEMIGADDPSS
jgi:hypothetical protein